MSRNHVQEAIIDGITGTAIIGGLLYGSHHNNDIVLACSLVFVWVTICIYCATIVLILYFSTGTASSHSFRVKLASIFDEIPVWGLGFRHCISIALMGTLVYINYGSVALMYGAWYGLYLGAREWVRNVN